MNEWLKKMRERIAALWSKWTLVQKLILGGVVLAVVVGIIVLIAISGAPTSVQLIRTPIKSDDELRLITAALDEEGIAYDVSADNIITVKDEDAALRAKSILIREDLIPKGTDPWAIFDMERWTITDFERDVNLRRAITGAVTRHIEAIEDIDKAQVTLVMPEERLFAEEQNPVTASVIIYPKPGSDIITNRKKIEGIQRIVKLAVEGLLDENIVITDQTGYILNDFAGFADVDRLELTKREQKYILQLESQYKARLLTQLQTIYGRDRVPDLNLKIYMDMSKKLVEAREFYPVTVLPDDPKTPYYDGKTELSITRSSSETAYTYKGTGFNPEGPAGAEGQTPPAYKDMSSMNGEATQTTVIHNEEINERTIQEERAPTIDRISVSVNIDGLWVIKHDEAGNPIMKPSGQREREYIPLKSEEIKAAEQIIMNGIGFDRDRGDTVTVQNIPFDRTEAFRREDDEFIRNQQINAIILWSLAGIAALMVIFIIARLISREIERKRRLEEEKRALQQQMARENAIRQAEEQNIEVSMSVEERKRLELQEHAINMAKEHPEDVAQLIRTWLREE